jgi:thiosulfate dehydrogenase
MTTRAHATGAPRRRGAAGEGPHVLHRALLTGIAVLTLGAGCSRTARERSPLVPATTTMVTAWQVPQNPLDDKSLDHSPLAEQIRWGYRIFTNTPGEAPRFTGGRVSCANCHLNVGQRERALPLVGVAGMFPEYNYRAARLISLADRVVDCFLRSENATGRLAARPHIAAMGRLEPIRFADSAPASAGDEAEMLPTPASKEVLAVSAFISWLSRGYTVGRSPAWRGRNAIAAEKLVPVERLDPARGQAVYGERCQSCHGADGQGVQIGDKKAGPLWGPDSWNDGAGAARVYTLAGIIRYTMPYLDPGSLSDADAQHVAAYVNSQPRPEFPFKDRDYIGGKVPVDALYYRSSNSQRSSLSQ